MPNILKKEKSKLLYILALSLFLILVVPALIYVYLGNYRLFNYWVSIRGNMHALETLAEIYALDHGGKYPPNLSSLWFAAHMNEKHYWREFKNPCEGGKTNYDYWFNPDYQDLPSVIQGPNASPSPCAVVYEGQADGKSYLIRAFNYERQAFMHKGTQPYIIKKKLTEEDATQNMATSSNN